MTLFYLEGCPYCRKAQTAMESLLREHEEFRCIPIEWVEESQNPSRAQQYDYYYVPSAFSGKRKLYECRPGADSEEIREHLKKALEEELRSM